MVDRIRAFLLVLAVSVAGATGANAVSVTLSLPEQQGADCVLSFLPVEFDESDRPVYARALCVRLQYSNIPDEGLLNVSVFVPLYRDFGRGIAGSALISELDGEIDGGAFIDRSEFSAGGLAPSEGERYISVFILDEIVDERVLTRFFSQEPEKTDGYYFTCGDPAFCPFFPVEITAINQTSLAPVPLPAGLVFMITALFVLGVARYRVKQ